MKRLVEWAVGLAILAGMVSASVCSSKQFYGSWGAEPTPEVLAAWANYKAIVESPSPLKTVSDRRMVRASAPVDVFDVREQKMVRAVKVEYLEEFEPQTNLVPRREVIIIGYDGGRIVRFHYDGKGPKEYREAF